MHDPQQELYTRLLLDLKATGYDVYDGTPPPKDTPYPFIYLGDFRQADTDTKTQTIGTVYPKIHVWHNRTDQRGTVSQMLLAVKTVCRKIERTDHFKWNCKNMVQNLFTDNSTNAPLLHGVIDIDFNFT